MSRCAISVSLLVGVISLAGSAAAGTVGYWRFEEGTAGQPAAGAQSVLDSSGNGLHGTAAHGPVYDNAVPANPVPRTGATNSLCLSFNGINQKVQMDDAPEFQLTHSLTIEAFINPRSTYYNNNGQILLRGDSRGGHDPYYLCQQFDQILFSICGDTNPAVELRAPVPMANQWFHVAATLDDATGEMRLYINGQLANSRFTTVRPAAQLDPSLEGGVSIGDTPVAAFVQPFDGAIDEVRLSGTALTPSEFLNAPEPGALAVGLILAATGLRRRALR